MSGLNQNYASAIYGFTSAGDSAPQCFRSASAVPFNQLGSGGELAAAAVFWIDAGIQTPDSSFETRQFIWGNLDDDNSAGWGIYLEPDALSGQMLLVGSLYTAGGLRTSYFTMSDLVLPGFVERLICAALWYDGASLTLSVNGSFIASDESGILDPYAASALPATLGGDFVGVAPATDVRIVSAAYTFSGNPSVNRNQAGGHFVACRAAAAGGYLIPRDGVDWAHRYEAEAATTSGSSGSILKSASGALQLQDPIAPTSLTDVGNLGPAPIANVVPAALTRLGATDLRIAQVAQPDWYAGSGFEFANPVPA